MMSPEQKEKADMLVKAEPGSMSGYMLGGIPEEKPELPMHILDIGNEQDIHQSPLATGGMKEIVMNVDDEIYELLGRKGSKEVDKEGEIQYSLPLDSIYREMQKFRIPNNLVDDVIEHFSYYGFEKYFVDMGGRKVAFIKTIDQ